MLFFFSKGPFKDCHQAKQTGYSSSGIYMIKTENSHGPVQLWCDNSLDPGGWTVIQKRTDGSVNFFTNWDNYKVIIKKYPRGNLQCTVTINFPHSVTFSICWITTFCQWPLFVKFQYSCKAPGTRN